MKWTVDQVDQYLQAKEYFDTAIVPLIPIDIGYEPKENISKGEFILAVTDIIEKQFVGRMIQMPPFTYIKGEEDALEARLRAWNHHFSQHGFKHVFYVTSDKDWESLEGELVHSFIWLPELSISGMNDGHKKKIVLYQSEKMFPLITDKWKLVTKE